MKVIHLISGGDSGGAKTHVLSLLRELNGQIAAQLVCFRDGPFAQEARALEIPTRICGGNNIPHLLRALEADIRQGGYALIHCHGSRANMVGALLRRRTHLPVVSTVHSDYKLDYMGRPFARMTFGAINAWALRHLDYRIGVSDAMVDLLIRRGFPPDRCYAIYNGIDFSPPPPQGDRVAYLRSLGAQVDGESVVVGIAARLNPVKDMATLIRGFALARKTCPRLHLILAGEGEERQRLEALSRELGVAEAVTFAGWIAGGMDAFYAALDINTLTSLSETFPYALTEGARFRLATAATAVGGVPALIDDDVNGFLFTPGDHRALGRCLARLGQDDALRREMGQKLWEKASRRFSIQHTVETQLHIYREILRRHSRPRKDRDGVVICGAYGRGNAGDDAILEAILGQMRTIDPDMPITVLSKDPLSTRVAYRVRTAGRTDILSWQRAMRRAALYINGGGSLIQDVTSRRSLWFYLHNIQAARRSGCRVQMYGCGIGPVLREEHRRLAARVMNTCVDAVTLREPDSLQELQSMGVDRPEICLTADPALTLSPAGRDETDSVLLRAGIPPEGAYLCFALRQWKGFEEKAPLFAQAARYAYQAHALTPVFFSVEKQLDAAAGRLAAQGLDIPHHFLDDAGSAGTIIGALSRMRGVVSMRLHALIFAAGQGIPLAGVVYDPKVSAFLRYIGQENFCPLEELTLPALREMIARLAAAPPSPEAQAQAVARLRQLERGNVETARRLMGLPPAE